MIGAGPVGLAAAAHLARAASSPSCSRPATRVGASVREWGHVRVFSPWEYNIDPVAVELLERHGLDARRPADGYPTGDEIVERYLEPLAAAPGIAESLHLRRACRRRHAPGHRQAQGRRAATTRRSSSIVEQDGERAALPRPRGDRRLRHVDAAEPARRRRRARRRRARARRPHRLRHPRRARRRARALRRQARARRRQRPLRLQRDPRPRRAARLRAGHRDRLGDPRRRARTASLRRRRATTSSRRAARSARPCRRPGRPTAPSRSSAGFQHAVDRHAEDGRSCSCDDDARRLVVDEIIAATGFRPDLDSAARAAARARRPRRGAARARSADRPQPALVRLGPAARRRRALAPGAGHLHRRA